MVKKAFATNWKRSTQPRKQRKYMYNAPLHVKQKMLHVHLSPELREKHGLRNVQIKKGDKVKILRGKFAKKEGKVDKVNLKNSKVFVAGIEIIKKEGTKLPVPLVASNLMITNLELNDKKRKLKLENKKSKPVKSTKKTEVKESGKETSKPQEKTSTEDKQ